MMTMRTKISLAACLLLIVIALTAVSSNAGDAEGPPVVVGRIYAVEDDLLRYVPESKDWVAMVKDAPFGVDDTLFAGSEGLAELIVPNRTWIRIGNSTQIQFIDLTPDMTEVDVASGIARFYNKSDAGVIKATCEFGYVLANAGTIFDFYVGDNSVEVIPIEGTVTFVHSGSDESYDVVAGTPSILADSTQVASGEGMVDADWDTWNADRDQSWAEKSRVVTRSSRYVPPSLRDESYALDESGQWDSVDYEGESRMCWRPSNVSVDWAPFTVGRWTDWDDDQVWVPAESFGYITHHYGNWIISGGAWYWAPPALKVRAELPNLGVDFYWNPGRVSWIHRDNYVGWFPLAPREVYYSHRRWGNPEDRIVSDVNIRIDINIGDFRYVDRACVVDRERFSDTNDYANVRVTNINKTTIINNYYAAPVVNNTVINNYGSDDRRHNFTNQVVREKPHRSVITRIEQNERAIKIERNQRAINKENQREASVVQEQVRKLRKGKVNTEARIQQPEITNHIVPVSEVDQPKEQAKFEKRELKRKAEKPKHVERDESKSIAKEGPAEKPALEPEKIQPPKEQSPKEEPQPRERPTKEPKATRPPKPDKEKKSDQDVTSPEKIQPPTEEPKEKPTKEEAQPRERATKEPKATRPPKPDKEKKSDQDVTSPEKIQPPTEEPKEQSPKEEPQPRERATKEPKATRPPKEEPKEQSPKEEPQRRERATKEPKPTKAPKIEKEKQQAPEVRPDREAERIEPPKDSRQERPAREEDKAREQKPEKSKGKDSKHGKDRNSETTPTPTS